MPDPSVHAVLSELAQNPRGDDLARLVHAVAFTMADERRAGFETGLEEAKAAHGLRDEDGQTSFGNVLTALARPDGHGPATRVLLGALLARGVALSPPANPDAEMKVAETLVWLAAHTPIDGLTALDATLGEGAKGLFVALSALIRRWDDGMAPLVGRAGALVAAAALGSSASSVARHEAKALHVRDRVVARLLSPPELEGPSAKAAAARGELLPTPRGPVATMLLALTGLLLVLRGARLFARFVLGLSRRCEVRAGSRGLTIVVEAKMLGRTLRTKETFFPMEGLARVARDVRYPRIGLYAGLIALALGSYLGTSILVSGARAGSPELLGVGALIAALGALLDYGLVMLGGARPGRARLIVEPRRGPALAVGDLAEADVDALISRLRAR